MRDGLRKFAFRSGVGMGPDESFMMVAAPVTLLAWAIWLPLVWLTLVGWIPVYLRFRTRCVVIDEHARALSVRNFWATRTVSVDDVSAVEWRSRFLWFTLNVRTHGGGDILCGGVTKARKTTRLLRLRDVTAEESELNELLVRLGVAGVRLV